MTVFVSSTTFSRGEIDSALYDLRGQDFYAASAQYIRNWVPDRVGGLFKRPPIEYAYYPGSNQAQGNPLASVAPVDGADVSLTRTINISGVDYDFTSKDLYIRPVTLGGAPYAILVETLSRTDVPDAQYGNGVNIMLHPMSDDDPKMLSPRPSRGVMYQQFFDNASADGSFHSGFPYNTPETLTPALSTIVRVATAGPAAFMATARMPVIRLYVDNNGNPHIDAVQFYEELVGEVTAEKGSDTWTGTDTLFTGQLAPGDTFLFDRETYTVKSVASDTEFVTNETTSTLSITEKGAVARDNPFGMNQHPAQVTFFQNRLVLASTNNKPTGVWLSQTNQPFIILAGNADPDSPINYELFAPEADLFKWAASTDRIYLGGGRSEFSIGEPNVAITPTNFSVTRIGTVGSANVNAAVTGTAFIHTGAKADRLFAVQFSLSSQSFQSSDITFLAPHLFSSDVESVTYRPATHLDPTPRIFALLENGQVQAAAYEPDRNLIAWSRFEFTNDAHLMCVNASELATYFVFRDETNDCYTIAYYDGDYSPTLFGDFAEQTVVSATNDFQVKQPYYGKTISVVVKEGGTYRFAGFFTADSTGMVQTDESALKNGAVIYYMFGYTGELEMLPVAIEDPRGMMLNRKRRLVRALVDVLDTWQLYVNNEPMLPPVNPHGVTQTGVYTRRVLGWNYNDSLRMRTPYTFKARIRSITREVSI